MDKDKKTVMKDLKFCLIYEVKRITISKLLVSFLIGVMALISLATEISTTNDIYGTPKVNYIRAISISDILVSIIICIIVYFVLNILLVFSDRVEITSKIKLTKKFFLIEFITIFLLWIPIYVICFPGGIFSDTFLSLGQAMGYAPLDNHHPILYTLLIRLISRAFHTSDLTIVCAIYVFIQMIFMELAIVYFSIWLNKHKIRPICNLLSVLFLVLFPYIPLNAITMWKDTAYCIMMMLFSLTLSELCFDIELLNDWKYIFKVMALGILVSCFRNNGIYVFSFSIVLIIVFNMIQKKEFRDFTLCGILTCLILGFIQGPVYNNLGLNTTSTVESLGVPAQQIASVIYEDRDLSSSQEEILFNICSEQDWKNYYSPCIFDQLKWYAPSFNSSYLDSHKIDFLKIWIELLPSNIDLYLSSYFMATNSFYNLSHTFGVADFYTGVWFPNQGVNEINIIKESTGIDLKVIINKFPKMRESWFILFLIVFFWLALSKNKNSIFAFLPSIISTLTILIATPIASQFRYIFYLVLLLPLFIVISFLNDKRGKHEIN